MCVIVDCICVETLWLAVQFLQIEENNRITILMKHFTNWTDALLSVTKILLIC